MFSVSHKLMSLCVFNKCNLKNLTMILYPGIPITRTPTGRNDKRKLSWWFVQTVYHLAREDCFITDICLYNMTFPFLIQITFHLSKLPFILNRLFI